MDLLISDRGGLILDSVVGIHEDVIELDFASLYPNIMFTHNISPETLLSTPIWKRADREEAIPLIYLE